MRVELRLHLWSQSVGQPKRAGRSQVKHSTHIIIQQLELIGLMTQVILDPIHPAQDSHAGG